MKRIKIGGHRGYWISKQDENTITSMIRAEEAGMDYVEIDLQYTKDNKIVIVHDDTIEYQGKEQAVTNLTYEQIRSVNSGIPTLTEVLDEFQERSLAFFLEIKPCTNVLGNRLDVYIETIYEQLVKFNLTRICLFSIDYDFLIKLNLYDDENKIQKGVIVTEMLDDPIQFMKNNNIQLYLAYLTRLNETVVKQCKKENFLISASIINTVEDRDKAITLGVDMFETDCFETVKLK